LFTALATLGTLGLRAGQLTAALYMVAVILGAWYGGLGPGILASVLSAVALYILFAWSGPTPPAVPVGDMVELGVSVLAMLLISTFAAARWRARMSVDRELEQRRVALANIGDGVITTDTDGRVTFMNDAAQALTGWSQVEAAGRPLQEVFPLLDEETRTALEDPAMPRRPAGQIANLARHALLITKTAGEIPIQASGLLVQDQHTASTQVVLVFHDVTERRRSELSLRRLAEAETLNTQLEDRILERTHQLRTTVNELRREISERQQAEEALRRSREQLRRLSARLQAAREEERKRIAREIHDQLGGAMTGLKMDVAALRRTLQTALLDKTGAMGELIDDTIQSVRRIATELRPAILDDFGLLAAIEWQLQEFQTRAGIQCHLVAEVDNIPLDSESSTAVFRVFQETLTNVARHANATQVDVRIEHQDGQLTLQVHDNGRGISEEEISGSKSLGLVGMQERIHLLSGELDIRGAPGLGTTVLVKIPLERNSPGSEA
jgi:PAS domain S-box-containing protein